MSLNSAGFNGVYAALLPVPDVPRPLIVRKLVVSVFFIAASAGSSEVTIESKVKLVAVILS
jgi:hypothetical protein